MKAATTTRETTLAAKFERHADHEGEILERYRALSDKLGSSSAGMVVNQILTDEEVHHLLLRTIAAWLKGDPAARERSIAPDVNRGEILRLTRTLQKHERETIDTCRALIAELPESSAPFFSALLAAMALDSEKHHRLLKAVESILGAD